ncbi:MAG TPA: queuosine precursor transporter [Candidatus Woesebacteria bacterium]|nr:queuosine precursor transporter [Candidatus Woesebacteria bacterium]
MFKTEKMDLLVSVYVFCIIVAELMGAKTFPLLDLGFYKLNASVSIFLIPLLFTINDIVVEVHGKERARSIVRSGLFTICLLFGFIILAIHLPPSMRFIESEVAYDEIFGKSARITLASLTAFALADFLDIYIFSKIREKFGKSKLWLRNNLSNFIAQLIDTVVFMTLAFYALNEPFGENVAFLFSLILPYWLLKCSMSIIETPFVYLGVKWLRSKK